MNKLIFIFLLLLLSGTSFSQQFTLDLNDTILKEKIEVKFQNISEISSTSIPYNFLGKFIKGGDLSTDLISSTSNIQKSVNRFGIEFSSEFSANLYQIEIGKDKKYSPTLVVGQSLIGGIVYSKNWFDLVFKGNQTISNADFSGLNQSLFSFQKIGIGIINRKNQSNYRINFYGLNNYESLQFDHFKLIQNNPLDSIRLQALGDLNLNHNQHFFNGFGVGIDLDYRYEYVTNSNSKSTMQFKISNLGFSFLQKFNSYHINIDKYFDGYTLSQLKSINNQNAWKDTLGINTNEVRNKMILLPVFYQIAKLVNVHSDKKFQSFFGIKGYINLPYLPLVFFGGNYKVYKDWTTDGQISFGGFTKYRFAFGVNYLGDKFKVRFGTNDVYGLFTSKGYNKSIYTTFIFAL